MTRLFNFNQPFISNCDFLVTRKCDIRFIMITFMEPTYPHFQYDFSTAATNIKREDFSSEKPKEAESPCHSPPVKLESPDDDCIDMEIDVNEFYLGNLDPSDDESDLEEGDNFQLSQMQTGDSKVVSSIVFNFCENSDPDEDIRPADAELPQPTNSIENSIENSPQAPDNVSSISLDEVSITSIAELTQVVEEDEKLIEVVKKYEDGEIKNTVELLENLEEGDCKSKNVECSPLQKCQPTIPFFVSSYDYDHKLGKFDSCMLNNFYVSDSLPCSPPQSPMNICSVWSNSDDSERASPPIIKRETSPKEGDMPSPKDSFSAHSPFMKYKERKRRRMPKNAPLTKRRANGFLGHNINKIDSSAHEGYPLSDSNTGVSEFKDMEKRESIFSCPECSYRSNIGQIIDHYCFRHFSLTCPGCDESIEEPQFLTHCKNCKTSKDKLHCPDCQLTCTGSSLLSLALHIRLAHATKECVACGEKFVPQKFVKHAKTCFFGPKHTCTCPFCEKQVPLVKLSEHVITHPIAECPLCNIDITYQEAEQHVKSCYLEKVNDSEESYLGNVFKCPICEQRYSFENMPQHIILKHLSFNCVFCYNAMLHNALTEHVVLCCQRHQNLNVNNSTQ